MKIVVDYNDGHYNWRPAETRDAYGVVEVPDSTVALWEALNHLADVQQKQLRELDDRIQTKGVWP